MNNDIEAMSYLQDWRKALRSPYVYRVANRTFRVQNYLIAFLLLIMSVPLTVFTVPLLCDYLCMPPVSETPSTQCQYYTYNKTYPITTPVKLSDGISFRIGIVTDSDHDSKSTTAKNTWHSLMRLGTLLWNRETNSISVTWDDKVTKLSTSLSMNGRGMELSELITFDGRLLSFDDRTGTVYSIVDGKAYPWVILMDGNGKNPKGFKSEWATIKDEQLYVGSMGKEWTTASGEFIHNNPQWIKVISPRGEIHSINWISNYKRLRRTLDIEFPGYMIHECGAWSDIHKSWFFLPRRCSKEQYNETTDETMACNVLLIADENFINIKVKEIGTLIAIRGFSSFKFLPNSNDSIIVALKTEEFQGHTATYITAFTIEGTILLPDMKIMDEKFEGFEFV